MSNREEIRLGLETEYAHLNECINDLEHQVERSDGAIRLYRKTRLDNAIEARERLNGRMQMLTRASGEHRWNEAEKLWSDVRNAVLGIAAHA